MAALDSAAVAEVDSTGQAADILGLPDHLEDALWRVEAASLQPAGTAGGLIVAGMGGSGVGGALARAALWPGLARPLELARGADLPAWTGPDTLVLCSSYSGNTEETLAAYDAAGEAGAPRVVSSSGGELPARARRDKVPVIPLPGGFQPRAAVGYSFVVALEVAAVAGCAPSLRPGDRGDRAVRALAGRGVGARRRRGRRGQAARPRAPRDRAGDRRGRARRGGGLPLEVPAQRERQAPGVRRRAARGRPQRDRRLGRRRASSRASPPSSSRIPAPASGCRRGSS